MNVYEQLNTIYFNELKRLVETSKKWALQVNAKGKKRRLASGHVPKYAHLKKWIDDCVPALKDRFYTVMTKAYWILHGITGWDDNAVRCRECSRPFVGKNVRNAYSGYFEFCCRKCASSNEKTKRKAAETNLARYGGHSASLAETQAKSRRTRLEKYGYENWNNAAKMVRTRHSRFNGRYAPENFAEKCRRTKVTNGHPANWCNREQATATRRNINGGQYESPVTAEKKRNTCMDRYGVEYVTQSDAFKEQSRLTCIGWYGVEHYNQTEEFKERSRLACVERYGVEHSQQSPSIRQKSQKKYVFESQRFDSSAEIEFFVYMRDCGYLVVKDPGISFEYLFGGEHHVYFPDFAVVTKAGAVRLVEIKGDQFFRKDGTMFCPYRKKGWTDEQYQNTCDLYEMKWQCMLTNGVEILKYNSDYMKFVRLSVSEKHGRDYAKLFRKS